MFFEVTTWQFARSSIFRTSYFTSNSQCATVITLFWIRTYNWIYLSSLYYKYNAIASKWTEVLSSTYEKVFQVYRSTLFLETHCKKPRFRIKGALPRFLALCSALHTLRSIWSFRIAPTDVLDVIFDHIRGSLHCTIFSYAFIFINFIRILV